jgi:NodT family efflux transporter outer membrane factor (OMF) lipoprotein
MRFLRTGLALSLLVVGGCTVGPDYQPPAVAVPAAYGSGDQTGAAGADMAQADMAQWWQAFGDPVLDGLVTRALEANLDLRQAAARVAQARAAERAVAAGRGPSVNASAQAGANRLSENSLPAGLVDLGGGNGGGTPSGGLGLPGEAFATFQAGFDASWEIDLFGGQRRAEEAARARSEAAEWSQRDAEVLLVAEVANTYQQYRALQRRVAVADETLDSERALLEFIAVRTGHGLVTTLDARSQEREIAQLAAQREDLAAETAVRVHALGTLLGLAPDALAAELAGAPAGAPATVAVPAGLPSELLQRRPDIRAAERELAAASANIGVATADLYPKFSLTGALQLASRALTSLLEADSILASGTGRLSLPLVGAGASRATVEQREARADEAVLAYQGEVLGALRDVEDALTRLAADRRRAEQLRAAELAARDAADTSAVRYRNGVVAYLEVLTAQQALLSARDTLTQAEAAVAQDEVALFKALGGGWDARRVANEGDEAGGRDG